MCRVIIADDEPKVALLIEKLIQWDELGLTLVATASDGISALTMIDNLQPDIVITDIRMPGYDGIELIERAKRLNPKIDFIIVSGYRHFDYAQKAIRFGVEDYLLKPLKAVEINQTLRKMIEKYEERDRAERREQDYSTRIEHDAKNRHAQFMSLLRTMKDGGQVADSGDTLPMSLEQINRDFDLDFKHDYFQAFIVKADVQFETASPSVRKLLMEKSAVVVTEAFSGKCHSCLLHPTERGVYGVVNFAEMHAKGLRRVMMTVVDGLQSQSELFGKIKVTIGVGRHSMDIRDLPVSVREAESAVANRLIYGSGKIIDRAGTEETAAIVNCLVTADVRKRLLQGVEILDDSEIREVIDGFARKIAAHEGMTGKAIGALCEECLQILRFGLKSQNAVDEWIDERQTEFSEKLDMCTSQKEVFDLLGMYATSLVAHVIARKKGESSKPVREAQKFILAHFGTPISLESISQQAGFNPTYFSLLFKKETGLNFLEYLTEVRVGEAKRLLSDPGKTIADVAAEVGYSDVKHFSRLFTRIAGIHPSKYRKLYY